MNILWITNTLFPEAVKLLTGKGELRASGGWMIGAANAITQSKDISLYVASVSSLVSKLTFVKGEHIGYYVLPIGKGNMRYNKDFEPLWRKVSEEIEPQIVHIHGSEYSHGLAYVNACGAENVVLSIQGMKSAYYYYYYYGISTWEVFKNITLHDILSRSMFGEKRLFKQSGELEKDIISKLHHIIGRTSWDKARSWAINPEAKYHFCNETLRDEFYDGSTWEFEKCSKHTIFLSQANNAIKGLHQVLKAMPIILQHYPDTIIRIAGGDLTQYRGIKGWRHYNGYMKFINSLLDKYRLRNKIVFLGPLNAEEMKNEYLNCNVFVCPSTIENSPNSLGEAQILGTPCIASYVGGIPDMMRGNEDNLYRFEEVEMLAEKVCRVFSDGENQTDLSAIAAQRHDPLNNNQQLLSIYHKIIGR